MKECFIPRRFEAEQGRRYYLHDKAAQFIYRRAKLPSIAPASEQGHRGIDHLGHFAGLTPLRAHVEWLVKERHAQCH
jgi:hypothetical protein